MKYNFWSSALLNLLIFIFAAAATLGNHFPIFGLNFLRAVALCTFIYLIATSLSYRIPKNSKALNLHLILFSLWFTHALIGTLVLGAPESAIREIIDLLFGFILFCLPLFLVIKSVNNIRLVLRFWQWAYLIAAIFATAELTTGNKLESNFTRTQEAHIFEKIFLVSTFDNPNNFGVFLLFTLPFLTLGIASNRKLWSRSLSTAGIILLGIQSILTASRAATIGCILFISIWMVLKKGVRAFGMLFALIILITLGLEMFADSSHFNALSVADKLSNTTADLEHGSSRERYNIFLNSMQMIVDTLFMGVGPGQFEQYVTSRPMPASISVPNPHSMLLEIASQYGLLIFLCFLFCLLHIGLSGWKERKRSVANMHDDACVVIVAALPAILVAMNINSTYMSLQFLWLYLGSMTALAFSVENKSNFKILASI